MNKRAFIHKIALKLKSQDVDLASGILDDFGLSSIEIREPGANDEIEKGFAEIVAYFQGKELELIIIDDIQKVLHKALEGNFHLKIEKEKTIDWRKSCKFFFPAIYLPPKIFISPEWFYSYKKGSSFDRRVSLMERLIITPGAAFGTGHHETTLSCLELLCRLIKKGDLVLDLGCGSGILGIAAAKLKARKVLMVDNDPLACEEAEKNCKINEVQKNVTVKMASIEDLPFITPEKFDLIVANLFFELIAENLENVLLRLKKPGGRLILSGILKEKGGIIFQKTMDAGLILLERMDMYEYSTFALLSDDAAHFK